MEDYSGGQIQNDPNTPVFTGKSIATKQQFKTRYPKPKKNFFKKFILLAFFCLTLVGLGYFLFNYITRGPDYVVSLLNQGKTLEQEDVKSGLTNYICEKEVNKNDLIFYSNASFGKIQYNFEFIDAKFSKINRIVTLNYTDSAIASNGMDRLKAKTKELLGDEERKFSPKYESNKSSVKSRHLLTTENISPIATDFFLLPKDINKDKLDFISMKKFLKNTQNDLNCIRTGERILE